MMKSSFSKLVSVLLAAVFIFMIAVIPASADEPVDTTDLADPSGFTPDDTSENSYIKYQEANKGKPSSTGNEITADISSPVKVTSGGASFNINVSEDGFYNIGFSYKYLKKERAVLNDDNLTFSLKIDGAFPFNEAKKFSLACIYVNQLEDGNKAYRQDGLGNQFAPKQIPTDDFYFDTLKDITKWSADDYYIYLTAGAHTVTVSSVVGEFEIEKAVFANKKTLPKYEKPSGKSGYYNGDGIVIEAETATKKTTSWLAGKTDNSTLDVTPNDAYKTMVNYIGGGNWKTPGQTLVWDIEVPKDGYYQLGFSYRQGSVIGSKVYRSLKIDGEIPFAEAADIGFKYSYDWRQEFFADKNENPYLFKLEKGKHEISLTVVPGDVEKARDYLKEANTKIGELYVDITMITGETVDIYRDYDLFSQISDMKDRLEDITSLLSKTSKLLQETTGEKSGSYVSIINNMRQICQLMHDNRYTAHRYKSEYYSKYTSLASVLSEMSSMPLDLDKISLTAPGEEHPFSNAGFFKKFGFSVQKFLVSFTQDYNNISNTSGNKESITLWVNWGRDQAQVLNALIQSNFSDKENINVNVQLVNASVVQAVLSGKGPDCLVQTSRSEPVNLAMRGMLYSLSDMPGYKDVIANFHEGADQPYWYKGDLYALPDTQQFYMMFYRTDILSKMGIKIPESTEGFTWDNFTWDDFQEDVKLLARNNLTAWLPNNTATSVAQANIGIGSINLFPSLLLQRGLKIYKEDGRATNLKDSDVVVCFNEWTDMYSNLKLPRTLDFYNRFRTGTCPIGISTYTLYTTLKAAAPEIDGLWNVAPVPGTLREDGTIDHTTSGGGSACCILKLPDTNRDAAWKFLKWWVSSETQLAYSREVESILGPTGRVSVSNRNAFEAMEWDEKMRDVVVGSFNNTKEISEFPGSYYVSRSVYQAFWNVVENNQNPKDTLLKYAEEADQEIARKWKQYENRDKR